MLSNNDIYCQDCIDIPNSHSFELLCKSRHSVTNQDVIFYYTKVSNAIKYNDTNGILEHYENLLTKSNPDSWIWVFDCNGFGLKHSLEIKTAIGISKIINKFGKVKNIFVINSNYFINAVQRIVNFVLDNEISKNIILIKKDEKTKYLIELTKYLYYSSDDYYKLSSFM
jgi:hypothetical protein